MAIQLLRSKDATWGRLPHSDQRLLEIDEALIERPRSGLSWPALARGNGLSYGDVGLNSQGVLLGMSKRNAIINFSPETGIIDCEAGASIDQVLKAAIPSGWFLPVLPGTRYVTLGGAVANDVHGKNHHREGTFGRHVIEIRLLQSSGARMVCNRESNSALFKATLGGLGLTGVMERLKIQLKKVSSPFLEVESFPFGSIGEFLELSRRSEKTHEYVVAWVDAMTQGNHKRRGVLFRANHAEVQNGIAHSKKLEKSNRSMPEIPFSLVGQSSVKVFNEIYIIKKSKSIIEIVDPYSFFFPLDSIKRWNRIYGPKGFYQYQCVVPKEGASPCVNQLLSIASRSGMPSFLSVLKNFGALCQPGLLSFPIEGTTLALDFPNKGKKLLSLFNEMDSVVDFFGGRLYAAKDSRMSSEMFCKGQPLMDEFLMLKDPGMTSDFWNRLMQSKRP